MMPFLYPIRPTPFPILVINNHTHIENDDEEEDDDDFLPSSMTIFSRTIPIPMNALSNLISNNENIHNNEQNTFRLRMNVDGFQPNELNISIRHGRLIVRGKHIVRSQIQTLTTDPILNSNDDNEPDFVAKEFKRTFNIPSNADVRKAHAQFYPEQQLLLIEIPFQNSSNSSETRINRISIRPIDVFLTIVTILLMDRALRITYEQFMINEQFQQPTSQYRNRRRRTNHDIFI